MEGKLNIDDLTCDFLGGAVGHRFKYGNGNNALAKAIGIKVKKSKTQPVIVDATAGLGRDAFLMASLGFHVIMIERDAVMQQLLLNAMASAVSAGGHIAKVMARMTLLQGDAIQILPILKPEIILIDPMHPERKNSALVKKEMRQIRQMVGVDNDSDQLMQIALSCASKRVIVKWPQKSSSINANRPKSHQITGKSIRYDIWVSG